MLKNNAQKVLLFMQTSKGILEGQVASKTSRPEFRILPNIGNTCFLNSTVQALYQILEIRQKMEEYNGSKENIIYFLKILFQQMSRKTSLNQKRNTLENIQKNLENCLIDYVRESQYDAFQTFLAIFNMILEQFPSLSQLFQIKYSLSCNCDQQPRIFSQLKIDAYEGFCAICKRQFQRKFIKVPAYLIVFQKNGKQANKELKDLEAKEIDKIAKVIYRGDKKFGHYYTLCREDKFYSFNDSSYYQVTKRYYNSQHCQFSIYGKVQPIQEEPFSYKFIKNQLLEKSLYSHGSPSLSLQRQYGRNVFPQLNVEDNFVQIKQKKHQRLSIKRQDYDQKFSTARSTTSKIKQ